MNKRSFSLLICAALSLSLQIESALAGKFINFDVPGAIRGTFPNAINEDNTTSGYAEDNNGIHGFVRKADGTIISFDAPGAIETHPLAINAAEEIAGYYVSSDAAHGFVRERDGTITVLDFPNADQTYVLDINKNGEITGEFEDPGYRAFLKKRDGKFKEFGVKNTGNQGMVINDGGTVAGRYCDTSCWGSFGAFIRAPDGTISTFSVPGEQMTLPQGLNKSGLIAGTALDSNFVGEGFLRMPDGQITTDSQCDFTALNNKGAAVGTAKVNRVYHGCIRAPDGTDTFFDDPNAGVGDLQGTHPFGINNAFYVTGDYQDSNGNFHGFLVHVAH